MTQVALANLQIEYLADHTECIPTLARWHHEEWLYLNPNGTLEERIASLYNKCNHMRIPTVFVALDGDALIGSASLIAHDMDIHMELSPWLASVFVAPEHRQRGVGSALVTRIAQEAKALHFPRLYLFTPNRESFYSRLGWTVMERTEYRGVSVALMTLELAA